MINKNVGIFRGGIRVPDVLNFPMESSAAFGFKGHVLIALWVQHLWDGHCVVVPVRKSQLALHSYDQAKNTFSNSPRETTKTRK